MLCPESRLQLPLLESLPAPRSVRPVLVATRDTYLKAASLDFICCVPDMIIDAGIIVKIIVIPPLLRMVFYFFFFTGLSGAVLCAAKFLPA